MDSTTQQTVTEFSSFNGTYHNLYNISGFGECWQQIGDIFWFEISITIICGMGIIGNILNLIILNTRKLYASVDRMERSANIGFVALAVSDLMFCVVVIPAAHLMKICKTSNTHLVLLYIRTYSVPVTNLFLMISTWLIVAMAISRYFVVCHPIKAREMIDVQKSRVTILLIYVLSIVFTGPHFALNIIISQNGAGTEEYVMAKLENVGFNKTHYYTEIYVRWIWPVIADFIPFVVLFYFNVRLILAIRKSERNRRAQCPGQKIPESSRRVTLTLIIIIIMHIVLVSPAEIMKYSEPFERDTGIFVALISNVFQTVNFASNFVLYISVNSRFRQASKSMVKGCLSNNVDYSKSQYSAVSRTGDSWL